MNITNDQNVNWFDKPQSTTTVYVIVVVLLGNINRRVPFQPVP